MRQPTISLCMIVKNEAEHLPRCLKSVKGVVDEIIVVDTGSTDNTVELARQFGASVISSPWQNDFAYARNIGVDQAKGDWILWLDADEELEASDREKLRVCAQHEEFEAFLLQIYNYIGDGSQGATINPVLRMFRNRPAYRFEGRIHEQIALSIFRHKPDAALHLTDIKIHHYGYEQEIVIKKDKIRRNISMLQQMLSEKENDPFTLYNIGVEYLRIAEAQQALVAFRKAKSLVDPVATSYAHLLVKYEIRCLLTLGRVEEAIRICDEGIGLYPHYTDLRHIKGTCFAQLGKLEEAIDCLRHAVEMGPSANGYHTEEGIGTYQTCYALGIVYEAMRDYHSAVEWHMQAVRFKSSLNPPLYRIFHILRCTGAQSQIISFIKDRFHIKTEGALAKMIDILFDTDCLEPIPALAEQLKQRKFKEFKTKAQFKSHLLTGNLQSARNVLGHSKDPIAEDALSDEEFQLHVKIAFVNGRHDELLRMIDKWRNKLDSPEAGKRIVRTLASLADAHLEATSRSIKFRNLLQQARLAAPHEDGF